MEIQSSLGPSLWRKVGGGRKVHQISLARVLKETVLTYEEMTTITVQIEAVLNFKPLCPLSDDATDYSALILGHFLIGEAPNAIPEPALSDEKTSRLSRWQLLRQKTIFGQGGPRSVQRYQAVSKWHHPSNDIKEGTMVLIADERYPPGKWPLARVTHLHPGPDELTRVVSVKTATSTYKRPITKLCILPTKYHTHRSVIKVDPPSFMLRLHICGELRQMLRQPIRSQAQVESGKRRHAATALR